MKTGLHCYNRGGLRYNVLLLVLFSATPLLLVPIDPSSVTIPLVSPILQGILSYRYGGIILIIVSIVILVL